MLHKLNLTGQRFGRWLVLNRFGRTAGRDVLWYCRCECGTESNVRAAPLRSGKSRSCGCLSREVRASEASREMHRQHIKHGNSRRDALAAEYVAWLGVRQRCYYPKNISYSNYGGGGATGWAPWNPTAGGPSPHPLAALGA